MAEPLVSVLIPVYNAGQFLRSSVESILSQTYTNLEILIIDDGSTDGCMETISDLRDDRIHVLSQENSGRAVALNHALGMLHGEFYATHDADDISYPSRIEEQVRAMERHAEVAAVFTGYDLILGGRIIAPRFAAKDVEQCRQDIARFRMPAHDPTGMFRLSTVGGVRYEETLRVGAGLDYILRVGERFPMMVVGKCLYSYRVHLGAITRRDPQRRERMIRKVFERACERRRLKFDACFGAGPQAPATATYREEETGVVPHFLESVLDLRRSGHWSEALHTAAACLRLHPWDPYYYKPLLYSVAPLGVVSMYRSVKAGRKPM